MSSPETIRAQAQESYERGDHTGALKSYLRLLQSDPGNPDVLNDLGTVCFALGRIEESKRYLAAALKLEPTHSEARENLRMLCKVVGMTPEAVLGQAAEISPATTVQNPRDISVIVPAHGRLDVLEQCLEALCCQTFPAERYEVVLVANGLDEPAAGQMSALTARCRSHFGDRLRVIQVGQASIPLARNEGIRNARGQIVLQINLDAILSRTALAEHYAEHEGFGFDPRYVICGGRRFPESYKRSLFNYLYEAIPLYTALHQPRPRFLADAAWFVTCNLSCMREAYDMFGTYDPSYVWGSDTEMGRRWEEKHGVHIYVNTNIVGYHLHKLSFDFWKSKCIEAVPYWFRRSTGMSPEEMPADARRALREKLDASDLDAASLESEMRRLEAAFSSPESFAGETVMGERVYTLNDFTWRIRALLKQYRIFLQHMELWRIVQRTRAGGAALEDIESAA